MKALQFQYFGPPSALEVRTAGAPPVREGDVLVKIHASAITPSDVKNVAGAFKATLPRIPSKDFAGVIVSGEGAIGQEVGGIGSGFGVTRDGAHAEFVGLPAAWLSRKPKNLSMAQASACGLSFMTAFVALMDVGKLVHGETILITGVLGAVGGAATQIALWKGARIIGAGRAEAADSLSFYANTTNPVWSREVRPRDAA